MARKQIVNAVRVGCPYWMDDTKFSSFCAWLEQWRDCIDQVAFFTSWFHPPMPLDTAARHCEILKDRMARVREMGFSVGMNILDTVGHHPEHLDKTLQADYTYMTNIDGEVCLGSRCMNNPDFLENYVKLLYRLHCAADPDFIWVDDDVRYGHLPIGYACFCDNCIRTFNQKYGHSFTRAELKTALADKDNVQLRHEMLTHQSDKIVGLFRVIRQTVNKCNPQITLGFMTGERYFEGYDFPAFADALSDGGKYEIMWRPGGGAYTDLRFWEQYGKSCEIGRQSANLPPYVTSVQSELENCPYQMLKKSPRATVLEAEMDLSTGANGTAWNFLPNAAIGEDIHLIDAHMAEIRRCNDFMHLLAYTFDRNPPLGIHTGWHIHSQASLPDFFGGYNAGFAQELFSLGLPEAYAQDGAVCHLFTGRDPLAYSTQELQSILTQNVLLDAQAADTLQKMGLGSLVGFACKQPLPRGTEASEIYTDSPLNRGFAGCRRTCSDIFCRGTIATVSAPAGTEILGRLVDDNDAPLCDCSMGLWTNSLGGKIAVSAYYPWSELSDSQKSAQLKRLFVALSGNTLPAYVASYHRVRLVVRRTVKQNLGCVLLNTNMDTLQNVQVAVCGHYRQATVTDEVMKEVVLSGTAGENGYTIFTLPAMAPYAMYLLQMRG